ncbi:uncharacterized protein LOC111206959 [Brassica napus]|uniref:uncharacterized protein LOC111206959 n=1 Tax=Brassica napus TaxID=3708 RepID=UPI00207982CD|nr:uncharacterized protein LOC111206959 [Brassica napus]
MELLLAYSGLIWRLFSSSGSLWVAWVGAELLRGGSFCDAKDTNKGSWLWRKFLQLRPEASSFMRCEVRSGDSTFFWFDNWLGTGSIIDTTGDLGLRYLGIPRQARVAEACPNEAWGMRGQGRRVFGDVYTAIENAQKPDARRGSDVILWRHNEEDFKDHFSAARTWDQIRVRGPEVPWHHLVWFTQGVPRHAFIVWLTFKDRLSTGVRMRQWGIAQGCMLCGEPDESRDHLHRCFSGLDDDGDFSATAQ